MASDPVAPKKASQAQTLIPPTIAKAIIEIQKVLKPMIKSAENDAYDSSYVPLEDVTAKAHDLLAQRGIGVTQPMVTDEQGHAALETILFTGSGQGFSRTTKLALSKVDPQSHGSAVTYTRRYALMSTLGLTGKGDDDDGNKASGVLLKPLEEQLDRIKSLLTNLRYPTDQIAAEVFKIKTRDHAKLAITNYEKIVSMRVRDNESKENATKIEIQGADSPIEDESSPIDTLKARIKALGLASKSVENKFVNACTGKPFISKVTKPEDLKALDVGLTAVESGVRLLPAEWLAPRTENVLVEEPVA